MIRDNYIIYNNTNDRTHAQYSTHYFLDDGDVENEEEDFEEKEEEAIRFAINIVRSDVSAPLFITYCTTCFSPERKA